MSGKNDGFIVVKEIETKFATTDNCSLGKVREKKYKKESSNCSSFVKLYVLCCRKVLVMIYPLDSWTQT